MVIWNNTTSWKNKPYHVCESSTIMMKELERAAIGKERENSAAIFASWLADFFSESATQMVMTLVREMFSEISANVRRTEMVLTFVKYEYNLGGPISIKMEVNFEKRFFRELGDLSRGLQRVFPSDIIKATGRKRTWSVLEPGCG